MAGPMPNLAQVMDALAEHVAVLDKQGTIVHVNAAWRRFARDNPPGADHSGPDAGPGVNYLAVCEASRGASAIGAREAAEGIRAILEGRLDTFSQEYPCHSPAKPRWFLMTASPLATAGGGAVVIHADVTGRHLAEESLRDSELRLQLALEATGDGLWDWDVANDLAYLSPGYYALTGYREGEVTPNLAFLRQLVHAEDWPGVLVTMEAHLRGETPYSEIEYRMTTATGETRWIRGRGRVVRRGEGGVPLRMAGHITDITHLKAVEQALRVSEARYRAILEDQTEVIGRLAADGTCLYVNEAFCRFFGKTPEALLGHRWQPMAHADDLPRIEARLARLSPENPVAVIENRAIAADGGIRWMQFVNRAFFDDRGQLAEIQFVGRDITEQKQAEARQQALLEENTRLGRELMALRDRERAALARELHDELSQHLTAIRAYAAAIRRSPDRASQLLVDDAKAIEASARQIYGVSHRLMEGLHPQILDSASLGDALADLLSTWAAHHPEVRVRYRRGARIDRLTADTRIQLYRIVQECLANVGLHAQARRLRVFLGKVRPGGHQRLRLVVRDDGVGMAPEAPRSGYGLLVMRERTASLGGHLDIQSHPGRGMRVSVDVPLGRTRAVRPGPRRP